MMKSLKTIWKYWLVIAKPIGNFQARIIFTVFYLLFFSVVGIIFRLFNDTLRLHKSSYKKKTGFVPWEHPQEDVEQARRPY